MTKWTYQVISFDELPVRLAENGVTISKRELLDLVFPYAEHCSFQEIRRNFWLDDIEELEYFCLTEPKNEELKFKRAIYLELLRIFDEENLPDCFLVLVRW